MSEGRRVIIVKGLDQNIHFETANCHIKIIKFFYFQNFMISTANSSDAPFLISRVLLCIVLSEY